MTQDLFLPPAPQVCLQRVGSILPTREVPGEGSEAKGKGKKPLRAAPLVHGQQHKEQEGLSGGPTGPTNSPEILGS